LSGAGHYGFWVAVKKALMISAFAAEYFDI
jgi:hypothetical protein